MPKSFEVMVVEDDPLCRQRFIDAVAQQQELTLFGAADSVSAARQLLAQATPDVLVVDIGLPDGSGIDLIRHCKQTCPQVFCLVVTIYGDEKHVLNAMAAGASGYLQKDAPLSELGEAVVSIVHGGVPISPSIARALLKNLSFAADEPDAPENALTRRETEVLQMLAKGYSREEIAEHLHISLNTVSAHTKNIYAKLEVHSGAKAIHEARSRGWL